VGKAEDPPTQNETAMPDPSSEEEAVQSPTAVKTVTPTSPSDNETRNGGWMSGIWAFVNGER